VHEIIGLWPVHGLFLLLTFYMFYRRARQLPIWPDIFNPLARKR
jgi:lipopolysaccharide export system permease protein